MTLTEMLRGSLTIRTLPGEFLTIAGLRDLHNSALMLGIPTNAILVAIQYSVEQDLKLPHTITIHWRIPETVNPAPVQAVHDFTPNHLDQEPTQ